MKRSVVVLSVAHCKNAPGACWKGLEEYSQSEKWSLAVSTLLSQKGILCRLIYGTSLNDKIQQVNKVEEDIVLAMEIHFNACGGCGASGTETLYYPGSTKGKQYAQIFQDHLCQGLSTLDRGIKEGWLKGDEPDKVDYPGDVPGDEVMAGFLKFTKCTALILEPEFIEQTDKMNQHAVTGPQAIADAVEEIVRERAEER